MQLTFLQENLLGALQQVVKIPLTKPTLPILSCLLLKTENERLKISATNLETSIKTWLGARIEKEGECLINHRSFFDYIGSLTPQKLTLQVQEKSVVLQGENSQATFNLGLVTDYPNLPTLSSEKIASLKPQTMQKMIQKTVFATATDEARPVLTGVLILLKEGKLIGVATDGFRLSEFSTSIQNETKEAKLILPARALQELDRLIGSSQEFIDLYLTTDKNQIGFKFKDAEFICRLLEADYPDYKKIIPTNFTCKIQTDTQSFLQAVKTVAIFTGRESPIIKVKMDTKEQKLLLKAESSEVGQSEVRLEASIEGKDVEVGFNAKYLQEGLASIDSERIKMKIKEVVAPVVFSSVDSTDDYDFLHVIMPVRLN